MIGRGCAGDVEVDAVMEDLDRHRDLDDIDLGICKRTVWEERLRRLDTNVGPFRSVLRLLPTPAPSLPTFWLSSEVPRRGWVSEGMQNEPKVVAQNPW